MSEQKSIELRILDTEFNLKGKGNTEHIMEVSSYVNDELERIKISNPFTNHIRIAILGCMNITEQLFECQKKLKDSEATKTNEKETLELVKEELEILRDELEEERTKYEELFEEKSFQDREMEEKKELIAQYREHLRQSKSESETNRKSILDLQNQLFECQIELVKANKNHIEKEDLEKELFRSIEIEEDIEH